MSDGILKSNPDGIWSYFMSLNHCLEHIDEAVKDAKQTFDHLENRLDNKRKFIQNKLDRLESELRSLLSQLNQAKDDKERSGIQGKIVSVQKEIQGLSEMDLMLRRAGQKIPLYMKDIAGAQKNCVQCFSRGKRVLNKYLKLVEVETAREGFTECEYSSSPGQFGAMQYRGNTFYCNNNAFDPHAVDSKGRSNIQRMQSGIAPVGYDGQSVELHHMTQSENGGIMEVPGSKHREGHSTLHINTSDIPSGVNRSSFDVLRAAYWKKRADLLKAGGVF